jgi:AmmeMemoRadiSam system protein A
LREFHIEGLGDCWRGRVAILPGHQELRYHLEYPLFFGYVLAEQQGSRSMLTHELKRELLGIARSSIAAALQQKPTRVSNVHEIHPSQELLQPRGAFVTIRIDGELRGCIGYMESLLPLAEVVAEVAAKAALDDPRFSPLTRTELDHAALEISVLSPLHKIHSVEEVKVGTHGLMLELGSCRGVLLPQVATEYGWNAVEFLEAVCRKSGLHRLAWKEPDAEISVFSAEILNEDEILREYPA